MEPLIQSNSIILTRKYRNDNIYPKRGDIVIYYVVHEELKEIGRVIALSNEYYTFKDSKVYIRDVHGKESALEESYLDKRDMAKLGTMFFWEKLSDEEYLILSDKRIVFFDPVIPRGHIVSRVIWPAN